MPAQCQHNSWSCCHFLEVWGLEKLRNVERSSSPGNQPSAPTPKPSSLPHHTACLHSFPCDRGLFRFLQLTLTGRPAAYLSTTLKFCFACPDDTPVHGKTQNHMIFLVFQGSSWAASWGKKAVWTSCRVTGMWVSSWVPAYWPVTTPGSSTRLRNSSNSKPPSGEPTCHETKQEFQRDFSTVGPGLLKGLHKSLWDCNRSGTTKGMLECCKRSTSPCIKTLMF